jgi:hypothetical protein
MKSADFDKSLFLLGGTGFFHLIYKELAEQNALGN